MEMGRNSHGLGLNALLFPLDSKAPLVQSFYQLPPSQPAGALSAPGCLVTMALGWEARLMR